MKKTLLLAGVAGVFAFNANAMEVRPYVGMNLGYGLAEYGDAEFDEIANDEYGVVDINAGARIGNNFGLEVSYQQSGDSEQDNYYMDGTAKVTTNYSSYGIDAYGYMPINEQVELFASAGIAHYKIEGEAKIRLYGYYGAAYIEDDESETSLRFGLGGLFKINEHFDAKAMYRFAPVDSESVDYINEFSVGLRYNF